MNIFSFFRKTAQKTESLESIKIYLDEEIRKFKTLPLEMDTTAENIILSLLQHNELKRIYLSPSLENLYLLLIIRNSKTNGLILKRRINPFEYIREIALSKPEDQDYIWILQMHSEPTKTSSFRESVMTEPYNEAVFYERHKNTDTGNI